MRERFWERFTLTELRSDEWEALCDGCAKCCLHKLEDADNGHVHYTRVACDLLDRQRCRCIDYPQRQQRVSACVKLAATDCEALAWLPASCAYRRVAEGRALPTWHHLRTGDRATVHQVGASIRDWAIPSAHVHPDGLEEHIIHWVDEDNDG